MRALVGLVLVVGGCTDPHDGTATACLPEVDAGCELTFLPTFDAFYGNHIERGCAAGAPCHGEGARSGLVLAGGPDAAYAALLGEGDGRAYVVPGDPGCSELVQRLESDDVDFVMPRGEPLPDGAQCSVRTWVENGAER
jgi:hypothetical protein